LKIKYLFQDADKIEKLNYKGYFDEYFKIVMQGKEYYSNGYSMVSKEDLNKLEQAINQGSIKLRNNQRNTVKTMFNSYNKDDISHQLGVKYIRVNRFEVLKAFGQR
jgi:Ca2+-dependent lipid-binding protein